MLPRTGERERSFGSQSFSCYGDRMPEESPTRLIERDTLADLVESSRSPRLAHTIASKERDRRTDRAAPVREPSALRGLVFVAIFALLARAMFRWFFY